VFRCGNYFDDDADDDDDEEDDDDDEDDDHDHDDDADDDKARGINRTGFLSWSSWSLGELIVGVSVWKFF
jgi:ABC-type Zn2+ transport system substrate-binding protein/surface adhesin